MDELLENLNPEEIGRRAYINSIRGRSDLLSDCTEHNRMDLYEKVLDIWGENPTIVEPEETPKSLDELKEEKLDELESRFTERVKGSFITDEGYKMQFNTDDSLKMFGAIQLLESQNAESGYITDADDNTHYDIPLNTMKSVQMQMLNKYAQCHAHKQELRALINNAKTKEELNSIQITWPV